MQTPLLQLQNCLTDPTSWTRSNARMWSRVSRVGDRPPCRQNTCARQQHNGERDVGGGCCLCDQEGALDRYSRLEPPWRCEGVRQSTTLCCRQYPRAGLQDYHTAHTWFSTSAVSGR